MATTTMCERCEAPLSESFESCPRCFLRTPWAQEPSAESPAAWPDIWDDATTELLDPIGEQDVAAFGQDLSRGERWTLARALAVVAGLVVLAILGAAYAPTRTFGVLSLVLCGGLALAVVRQAWLGDPAGD